MSSTSAGEAAAPGHRAAPASAEANAGLWPVADALDHLRDFVADLAGFNGKSAILAIEAGPAMVTPRLISVVVPALVQLLRNAVTHGIEPPMERLVAGKPLAGAVRLTATTSGTGLRFVIRDDGRGVSPDATPASPGKGLAAAAERIAPLGGSITMLAGVPCGSAFVLALPMDGAAATGSGALA